jgi:DNA-directed RNA polymerase subunit RPC12/RpoP
LQPSGIASILAARNTGGVSLDAIQHELKEILEAHKLKATAQAVAALSNSDDPPPDKTAVDTTAKLVQIGKDLAGVEGERAKVLLEENERLRERLEKLESALREGKREDRQATMDWLLAMGQTNQTLIQMMVGLLQESRQSQVDLLKQMLELRRAPDEDPIRQIGIQMVMGALKRDPDQDLERYITTIERFGSKLGLGNQNVTNLEMWKFAKQIELDMKRWELEHEREQRRIEVEERKAKNQAEALARLGEAISGRLALSSSTGTDPGQPNVPSRRGLYRYQCLNCSGNAVFERPVNQYNCPYCHTDVVVQQPQPQEEVQANA